MKWYQRPPTIEELRKRAYDEWLRNPTITAYTCGPFDHIRAAFVRLGEAFGSLAGILNATFQAALPWDLPDDPFDPSDWWDLPRPDRDLEDWLPRPAQ